MFLLFIVFIDFLFYFEHISHLFLVLGVNNNMLTMKRKFSNFQNGKKIILFILIMMVN